MAALEVTGIANHGKKGRVGGFHRQKGFSLLEALIAVAMLGIIGMVLMNGFTTSEKITGIVNEQSNARTLVTEYIEAIRSLPFAASYPEAGANIAVPDGFTMVTEVEGSNDDITWQTSSGEETLQRISVSAFVGEKLVLKVCTFRTRRDKS